MKKYRFISLFLLSFIFLQSCSFNDTENSKEFKVAVIRYQHETCTFCPGGDTKVEDWLKAGPVLIGDEVLNAGNYVRGFVYTATDYNDMNLVGIASPDNVFGGSSRSWNTKDSFEYFMKIILNDLKAQMPVDGVYLALHGALAVRDVPRPEAEIAKRIRNLVGDDIPIVASFDLHGNEDGEFLKYANGSFCTKRYPHYDAFLQGSRTANYLHRILKKTYVPTTATRKPPILTASVLQWTGQSPSTDIMERARRWETKKRDVFVSIFYGFPWSDVPDVGATVQVMTNNDQDLANEIADDMAEYIWRVRKDFALGKYPLPNEAVKEAKEAIAKNKMPIVLADYSDRPGDATWILKELIDQKVENVYYAALRDENVLKILEENNAKVGDDFDMNVGGFTGEQAGKAVHIKGKVVFFDKLWGYDKVAAIKFGKNNLLMIAPAYTQIIYLNRLRLEFANPDDYDVFVLKSRVHFRRGFDENGYAKTIIIVDAPGPWFGTTRLDALDYQFASIDKLYPFGENIKF